MGRRVEQVPENYVLDNFRAWTDRSRRNLGVDTLDLVQLHCPPTSVYSDDALYDALDTLVEEGAVAAYGVSVEKVEEALAAIARPHVATVQIIANAFRLKPLDEVFPAAAEAGVGIIVAGAAGLRPAVRASTTRGTTFAADDHRTYNRDGSAFDVGETFSGRRLRDRAAWRRGSSATWSRRGAGRHHLGAGRARLAVAARRPSPRVIPGARNVEQARANAAAGRVAPLGRDVRRRRPADLRRAPPGGDPPPLVKAVRPLRAPDFGLEPGRTGRPRRAYLGHCDPRHGALTDPIAGGRTL